MMLWLLFLNCLALSASIAHGHPRRQNDQEGDKYLSCYDEFNGCEPFIRDIFYRDSNGRLESTADEEFLDSSISEQCSTLTTIHECLSSKPCQSERPYSNPTKGYLTLLTHMCLYKHEELLENAECVSNPNFRTKYQYCAYMAFSDCNPERMLECMAVAITESMCKPSIKSLLRDSFTSLAAAGQCNAKHLDDQCNGMLFECDNIKFEYTDIYGNEREFTEVTDLQAGKSYNERCRDYKRTVDCQDDSIGEECDSIKYVQDSIYFAKFRYNLLCADYPKETDEPIPCAYTSKVSNQVHRECTDFYPSSAKSLTECRNGLTKYAECEAQVLGSIKNDEVDCQEQWIREWRQYLEDDRLLTIFCSLENFKKYRK